jgi:membrane protease YdiL (CAAX protease family)
MTTATRPVARFQDLVAPAPAITITLLFLGVALLENTVAPWAPFYFIYIWLTTCLPMGVGGLTFVHVKQLKARTWIILVALAISLQLFAVAWNGALYPKLLQGSGVAAELTSSPAYDTGAALQAMLSTAAAAWKTSLGKIQFFYLGLIFLWAGFGEEIFFRGYLYRSLRGRWGVAAAAAVSSLLFGIRHATQLGLLAPDYPWGAAIAWSLFATVAGLGFCWLFEKTGSLTAPILAHYLLNLIPLVALATDSR